MREDPTLTVARAVLALGAEACPYRGAKGECRTARCGQGHGAARKPDRCRDCPRSATDAVWDNVLVPAMEPDRG